MSEIRSASGYRLLSLRLNKGLSINNAAKEIGIHPQVLSGAEKRATPHPHHAKKIADYHGLQVTDIWRVEDFEERFAA